MSARVTANNASMVIDSSSRGGLIVEAVFFGLLSVVILAGNTLVCVAFYRNRKLRTKTNYYLVSLAVADIMVGVFSVPYWVYLRLVNPDTRTVWYQVYITYDILCGTASIINLVMISLERCLSVTEPAVHRNLSRTTIGFTIAGAWSYALIVACVSHARGSFRVWYPPFVSTASFFLPLFIILVAYAIIYRVAKRRVRARRCRSLSREIRIAVTLAVVIGAFVIAWLLFFVMLLISTYCPLCDVRYDIVVPCTKWMHYSGSMVNPIIYTYRNRDFRQTFAQTLFSRGKKQKHSSTQPPKLASVGSENGASVAMESYAIWRSDINHSRMNQESHRNYVGITCDMEHHLKVPNDWPRCL